MKKQSQIYVPPSVFAGELLIWKGRKWKVQAFSDSTDCTITIEDGQRKSRGVFTNMVIVLEDAGKTAGTIKREKAASKRPARVKVSGFRDNSKYAITLKDDGSW